MKGRWVEKQSSNGRFSFTEAGQEIIGRLKAIDEINLYDREVKRAKIATKDGLKTFLLTTQLENLLSGVPLNTIVRIQYQGERKTQRGARFKVFKLWVLEEEKKPDEDLSWLDNPDEF